jgi:creatinine amidohydrolase
MLISESTWGQVETRLKTDDRAVVPLGSTEQHSQLSLATDTLLAERIAIDAARPLGIPVFPAVPYGITPLFLGYPGTVSLRVSTYVALLRDILDSLYAHGFRRIAFINAHGGNQPAVGLAGEWMAEHEDASVKVHDWWIAPKTLAKLHTFDAVASHASWSENFPWTRLPNEVLPTQRKPMVDVPSLRAKSPQAARKLLGDGVFGGPYQMPDDVMEAVWDVAVQETRDFLVGPWQ